MTEAPPGYAPPAPGPDAPAGGWRAAEGTATPSPPTPAPGTPGPQPGGWLTADVPAPPPVRDEDAALFTKPPSRTGPITRLVIELLLVLTVFVLLGALREPPEILNPLFLVVLLYLVADIAVLAKPRSAIAVGIEGHLKAIGWAFGSMGVSAVIAYGDLDHDGGPWVLGVGLALGGLNLYAHHRKAEPVSRRLMIEEGALGAFVAAIGLPIALGGALDGAAQIILPVMLLALGLVLAVTVTRRLVRRRATRLDGPGEIGWNAWFQENFFRHMLILAAVVVYIFLRKPIRDLIGPLFVPVEYGLGVTLLSALFMSLRAYLKKRLAEHPLTSPHRRHEETIGRQGEPGYDHLDQTMAAFLDRGDATPLKALGDTFERRGIPASRHLHPILSYVGPQHTTLVHPAWLYGARVGVLFLVALALGIFLGDLGSDQARGALSGAPFTFFSLVFGLGLFLSQWNRFGGPFWGRTVMGYGGLVFLFIADSGLGRLSGVGATLIMAIRPGFVGILVWLALLLLPMLHYLRRDKLGKPHYAVSQRDPVTTIERLRRETERSIMTRLVWLGAIGIAFFIAIGQITRFTGAPLEFLFNTYLVIAAAFLVHPMLLVAGLRLGKDHVAAQDRAERARRKASFDTAMTELFRLFAEMRYPPRPEEWQQAPPSPRVGPDGRPTPYGMPPVPTAPTAPADLTPGIPGFRPSEAARPPPHDPRRHQENRT